MFTCFVHFIILCAFIHTSTVQAAFSESASEALSDVAFNEASAVSEERVPAGPLQLIGRGIENRKTKEVIALACAGDLNPETQVPSCRVLRSVKLKPQSNELFYIGKYFDLADTLSLKANEEPTQDDFIQLVKGMNEVSSKHRKYINRNRNRNFVGWFGFLTSGGVAVTLLVKSITVMAAGGSVATGPFLLVWVGMMGVVLGVQELALRPVLPSSGVVSQVMANQEGWN